MKISVYHSSDDVFVAWKPAGPIEDCRRFALRRQRNDVDEVVKTWVGFAGQAQSEGERRESTEWSIQRFRWTDYMAEPGDRLRYQAVPIVDPDQGRLTPNEGESSQWSTDTVLDRQVAPQIEAHFTRGIVAAQWVFRRIGLTDDSPTPPGSPRADSSGSARVLCLPMSTGGASW